MTYEDYIKSDEWKKRREWALYFWEYRCSLCFSEDDLQVHHRTYQRLGNENLNDLIVLCKSCHERFHERLFIHNMAMRKFWEWTLTEIHHA